MLPCVYGDGGNPMAGRTCLSMGNWSSDPNFGECSTRISVMYQGLDLVSSTLKHLVLHTELGQKRTIILQENINTENVVEMLDSLMQLVAMTSALRDQSTANLEIILDVVSASRDIAGDMSLNTSQVAEVSALVMISCTCTGMLE